MEWVAISAETATSEARFFLGLSAGKAMEVGGSIYQYSWVYDCVWAVEPSGRLTNIPLRLSATAEEFRKKH